MQYLHVRNLEKYHPGYKDRTLIYCKTYFTLLNGEPDFELLDETDKWRYMAFIMIELQNKAPIPLASDYLARKGFNLKKRPIAVTLKMLQKFVEVRNTQDEALSVTEGSSVPYIEYSRVEESRVEKSRVETFTPPSVSEISSYCVENGYPPSLGKTIFDYYSNANWRDSQGKPVRSWKQKCIAVWFKEENKKKDDVLTWAERRSADGKK